MRFPLFHEIFLVQEDLCLVATHKKSIVDIDKKYDDLLSDDLEVSSWVRFATDESHLQETLVQLLIPLEHSLLKAIDSLSQSTDLSLLILHYETLWLFHINFFIQFAKQEGGLDI